MTKVFPILFGAAAVGVAGLIARGIWSSRFQRRWKNSAVPMGLVGHVCFTLFFGGLGLVMILTAFERSISARIGRCLAGGLVVLVLVAWIGAAWGRMRDERASHARPTRAGWVFPLFGCFLLIVFLFLWISGEKSPRPRAAPPSATRSLAD